MDITIRKALPEEAYEYTDCHIACWQSAYKGIIPDEYLDSMTSEREQRAERIKAALSDPGGTAFYCAEYAGRMIGRLIFGKSSDEAKNEAGEIGAFYLIEEFWDKGFGGKMMDFTVEVLKGMGYSELFLWVLEGNGRAIRFYEKYNFVFDGAKKEMQIGAPLIAVRYARKL